MTPRSLRVFDPSPTGARRNVNEPEEAPVKNIAIKAVIATGAVAAIVGVVAVATQLEQIAGRKWS